MDVFLQTYPIALVPIVLWCVWRIHRMETELMSRIRSDIAEIKNDIKWLIQDERRRK